MCDAFDGSEARLRQECRFLGAELAESSADLPVRGV
jgi:hypothetical protein